MVSIQTSLNSCSHELAFVKGAGYIAALPALSTIDSTACVPLHRGPVPRRGFLVHIAFMQTSATLNL